MTKDLENRLHRALQPIDPGDEFAQRVLQQVDAGKKPDNATETETYAAPHARTPWRLAWICGALAASVLAVAVYQRQQQEKAEGLAARAQVFEALHVTTDKLDLASRLVNRPL